MSASKSQVDEITRFRDKMNDSCLWAFSGVPVSGVFNRLSSEDSTKIWSIPKVLWSDIDESMSAMVRLETSYSTCPTAAFVGFSANNFHVTGRV